MHLDLHFKFYFNLFVQLLLRVTSLAKEQNLQLAQVWRRNAFGCRPKPSFQEVEICKGLYFFASGSNFLKKRKKTKKWKTKVWKAYLAYFKVKLNDQDKPWAHHIDRKNMCRKVKKWTKGTLKNLKFGAPMVWREPKSHFNNCYFF